MTPAGRVAAAIGVLDAWLAGQPAEKALTNWARRSRFAGSGDRGAVRDLVFDAIRRRRSAAWLGGAETGRGLVLGLLRGRGKDPAALFTGLRFAPHPLTDADASPAEAMPETVALDCPEWLAPRLRKALGAAFAPVMQRLRERAPTHLRVNLRQTSRATAIERLRQEEIATEPHALSPAALEVVAGQRRIAGSDAYRGGLLELQDAASQAVADAVPVPEGTRVLDLCAGGGGKTLAMAGRAEARWFAHDIDPRRMTDLPARAERAGIAVEIVAEPERGAPWDVVLVDAPCSGSGAWRRSPEGKWRLTEARLAELRAVQREVLCRAIGLLAPGGSLAYATCSLLPEENEGALAEVLPGSGLRLAAERRFSPLDGGDGFYFALLTGGG